MTRHDGDGRREVDLVHVCVWLHEDDHAELVRAALDEGCPPEALLSEIVHAWRVAREAEAEMAPTSPTIVQEARKA